MRNLKSLALIFLATLVLSCSSEGNNNEDIISVSDLVGTWLLISDIDQDGEEYVEDGDCDYIIVFTETTINGLEYYGDNCDLLDNNDPLIFTFDGDSYTFTEEGEVVKEMILELTSTTLKVRYDYVEDGEDFYDITTFTKQ